MKRQSKSQKRRAPRPATEAHLAGLKTSTEARRQATVKRLQTAIDALNTKKQAITVQAIYEECGLRYAAVHRNPEALALFRANSTHLAAQKKRSRRKRNLTDEGALSARDPLLNYTKPQLADRLRTAQQQVLELQHQLAVGVDASVKREAYIAELEARLAELEPYRTFVEQVRAQMHREEQGRFGNLPPGV